MKISWSAAHTARSILAVMLIPASLLAEPVSLKRVVELALVHATGAAITAADQARASANYFELRNNYIPQLSTGAGLGYSYGFPLALEGSAPEPAAVLDWAHLDVLHDDPFVSRGERLVERALREVRVVGRAGRDPEM